MNTYEERFAYNINRLRVEHDLTQKQFAERLGYSEKTVSKWECNGSVPNIGTLYRIASIFNVTIDELFCDKAIYLLGIDGGGTKTDFVISDINFNILNKVTLSGCNPIDIGLEQAKEILKKGIYEVCGDISFSSIVMFAGIAGGSSGKMKDKLAKFFKQFGFKKFCNGSDTQNIVSAALGDGDGVIIIMGTGISAIAKHGEKQERVSGWGYLFDNGGSGYSVARDALAAGFRYIDGSGEYTAFADLMLKEYADPQELLGALYSGGKQFIASFCPLVFECAEKDDAVCREIIRSNMDFAANVIVTAAKKVEGDRVKVVIAGGLGKQPVAVKYLNDALAQFERCELSVLEEKPVMGALIYAKKISMKSADRR